MGGGGGYTATGTARPRPFVASFSMGSAAGFTELPLAQFCATAALMMERRGVELTEADKRMFEAVRDAADGL